MRTGRGGSRTLGRVCGGGLLDKVTLEAGQSETKAQGLLGTSVAGRGTSERETLSRSTASPLTCSLPPGPGYFLHSTCYCLKLFIYLFILW